MSKKKDKFSIQSQEGEIIGSASEIIDELKATLSKWKKEGIEREKLYTEKRKELELDYKRDVQCGYKEDYTTWISNRFLSLLESFNKIYDHRTELIHEVEELRERKYV